MSVHLIQSLMQEFTGRLLGILRTMPLSEVAALSGSPAPLEPTARWAREEQSAHTTEVAAKRAAGRLSRRTPEEIQTMVEQITALCMKSEGGLRAEEIRKALGVEAKELPRALAQAVEQGFLSKAGNKRATTYSAGASKAPKKAAKPAKASKKPAKPAKASKKPAKPAKKTAKPTKASKKPADKKPAAKKPAKSGKAGKKARSMVVDKSAPSPSAKAAPKSSPAVNGTASALPATIGG